jgi:predicted aspartyl protease
MIVGHVNARREAMIQLAVLGERTQRQGVKAIIDTGYTGFLTLPSAIITTLELTWFMQEEGFLGDGSLCMFNVFEASVIWDGQVRPIEINVVRNRSTGGNGFVRGLRVEYSGFCRRRNNDQGFVVAIIGIDPDLFLQVMAGAAEIEAPIRDYAQESRDYFCQLHPQMAVFMGGEVTENGSYSPGVWEKEERQHAPVFRKLYQHLSGKPFVLKPNTVNGCELVGDSWQGLRQHVLSRIATEWSAASVYIWLMAHSTGELQLAIAQPLQDEVNHLAKFWGFSRWAFANSYRDHLSGSTKNLIALLQHHRTERSNTEQLLRLNRSAFGHGVELTFTFTRVMVRLRKWNKELTSSYLKYLLGNSPLLIRTPVSLYNRFNKSV